MATFNSDLAALEMSAALAYPSERKVFCNSTRRDNRGYVIAECSFHPGHNHDHRDVHSGVTWR